MAKVQAFHLNDAVAAQILEPLARFGVAEQESYPVFSSEGTRHVERVLIAGDTALVDVSIGFPSAQRVEIAHAFILWHRVEAGLACRAEFGAERFGEERSAELSIEPLGARIQWRAEDPEPGNVTSRAAFTPFAVEVLARARAARAGGAAS